MTAKISNSDPDPWFILRSNNGSISALKFCKLNGDEVLLSGSQNGRVSIWDLKTRRVKHELEVSNGHGILYVDCVKLNGETCIISHDRGGSIKLFSTDDIAPNIQPIKSMKCHPFGFCPVQLLEEDETCWLGYPSSSDSQVTIVELSLQDNDNQPCFHLKPTTKLGMVMNFRLFGDKVMRYAICGYEDGSIIVWDVNMCHVVDVKQVHNQPVMCIDVDWFNRKIISGSVDNILCVSKINQEMMMEESEKYEWCTTGFACVCVRSDGKLVCCGGWDGRIRLFAWKNMKRLAILKYHEESINAVSFSSDDIIAAGSKDGRITLWEVYRKI